jgi:hypothetical protein
VIRLKDPNLSTAAKTEALAAQQRLPEVRRAVARHAQDQPEPLPPDAAASALLRLVSRAHALASHWARRWRRAETSNRYCWRLK